MATGPRRLALDTLTAVLAVAGLSLIVIGGSPPAVQTSGAATGVARVGPPAPPAADPTHPEGGNTVAPETAVRPGAGPTPLGSSVPVHLDLPAIGVSTSLMALGLNADGTIAVPPLRRDAPAGWYRYLVTPGEIGPAVILGHVDTAQEGPAVFYRLRELRAGDSVTVRRQDGSTAVFTVSEVANYPKSAFPTEAVYGALDHPGLRLISCGGSFDPIRREYRGNVVAYAKLTATRPADRHDPGRISR